MRRAAVALVVGLWLAALGLMAAAQQVEHGGPQGARPTETPPRDLPRSFADRGGGAEDDLSSLLHMTYAQAKRLTLAAFDRRHLHGVVREANGNITAAANMAGTMTMALMALVTAMSGVCNAGVTVHTTW